MTIDLKRLRELERKATPGPWKWEVEDYSMETLTGPRDEFDFILAVTRCRACRDTAETLGEDRAPRCKMPNRENGRLITEARNALPEMLDLVDEGARIIRELLQWGGTPLAVLERFEVDARRFLEKLNP